MDLNAEAMKDKDADIYDLVNKHYENTGGIKTFFIDYFSVVENVDKIALSTSSSCNVSSCKCILRNFQRRDIFDHDNKKRFEIYSHSKNEESIIIQQIIDIIHILKYHLIDL